MHTTLPALIDQAEAQRNMLNGYPMDAAQHDGYIAGLRDVQTHGYDKAVESLANLNDEGSALFSAWSTGYRNGVKATKGLL